jgi:hypothetical protein
MTRFRFDSDVLASTSPPEERRQRWVAAIQILGAAIALLFLVLMLRPLLF